MISIENVNSHYGKKKILQGVSLQIRSGEIVGVLGPNGAGKSTLLSILATTMKPTNGRVIVNGYSIEKQKKEIRHLIGYVPQDISLWEDLTVKENLRFWSKFQKKKITNDRMVKVCTDVRLHDRWNDKVSTFSGGMKRKLNIAVALLHDPDILLMDEPTVGIDLHTKLEINEYMKLLAVQGKTIVYTTHDMSEILTLCNRIVVLKKGLLQFKGTIDEAKVMFEQNGMVGNWKDEEVIFQLLLDE